MILTEEFVNKQGSDNARAFFEMATSLGYTILCPEDETGSLKRGFMLQNQYGAIYSCPVGETALDVMGPILRFIIDFDRAGASTLTQSSRIDQLEERIGKIEKLLEGPHTNEEQALSTSGTKLSELKDRAWLIGHRVEARDIHEIAYHRHCRYSYRGKTKKAVFTDRDMLETYRKRSHVAQTWYFSDEELDILEKIIIHDEKLYAEHFGKPD